MQLQRKISILTKKKIVEYYKAGIKDEKRIRQEYGVRPTLLSKLERWYNNHFLNPQKNYYQTQKSRAMKRSKKNARKSSTTTDKSLAQKIKKLEKEKQELEKALEWERLKSHVYETMVNIAERDLKLPLRKKYGTKQSGK